MSKRDNFNWLNSFINITEPTEAPPKRKTPLYNISWNERQTKDLQKAIRNFNAKIARLEKKGVPKGSLPERVRMTSVTKVIDGEERIIKKGLKDIIKNRQDLQREINSLQRFSRKGAEELVNAPLEEGGYAENIKVTKWELDDIIRRTARVNKQRAIKKSEIEEIEMKSRGEALGYKRGQVAMGKQDENLLEPIVPFTRTMSNEERRRKLRTLRNESSATYWEERDEILKEAYIKGLYNNYAPEDVEEIAKKIRGMSTKEFRETFEAEGGTNVFEFVYPQRGKSKVKGRGRKYDIDRTNEDYQNYLGALRDTWGVQTGEGE